MVSMKPSADPQESSPRRLVLSVYLPSVVMAFGQGLLLPILPLYARAFDASYALIGVFLAGESLGMLSGDVPAGLLVRRWGTKRVMLLGGACVLSGVLAMTWAQSLTEAILYRFLSGAGMALWGIARHAYIATVIKTERRGRSIAVLGGMGRVGAFVGPAVGGSVGLVYGLRAPFVLYAGLGLVALAAVRIWVVEIRTPDRVQSTAQPFGGIIREHWAVLLSAGSGQLLGQMIRRARQVIIPLYAADIVGLDVQSVGLVISISSALDMLMFLPAGLVMDRFGRKFAYVPSFIIQGVGMLLIPLTASFGTLLAVCCLIGLGNGLGSGTMLTLGADLAPRDARGEFLGLWRFIGDAGSAGSPIIIGSMAEALGLVFTPFLMTAVGLGGAAVLGLTVPETLKRRPAAGVKPGSEPC